MLPRWGLLGLLALAALGLPACTTSRATLAWRQAWQEEERGDAQAALRAYGDATARNSKLTGAALNRIRLLALQPDRREEATLALDKILKVGAGEPDVAAFAAQWALWLGDAKLARQRIDAAKAPAADAPADVVSAWTGARRAVLAEEGRWSQAAEVGPGQGAASLRAVVAWNVDDAAEATRLWPEMPKGRERALLGALLARERGDWPGVDAALADSHAPESEVEFQILRAEAAIQAGDAGKAARCAGDAAQRAPADARATEVWAVAQLVSGQPAAARDLLAALTVRGAGWSAWHNLGIAQVKLGDLAVASNAFAQAAQRCPSCAAPVRNRDALQRLGF